MSVATSQVRGVDGDDDRIRILADLPHFPGLTVLGLLSHGTDLDVFDVWCSARRTRCVLKVVRSGLVDHPYVIKRFRREAELLMRFSHPNIVRAYETGDLPLPYLLEEAITGHTLGALLGRRRRLGYRDLLNLADQLSAALAYVHDHGFLHLDLKPSNIIAEAGRAKLIDFSLAHEPGEGPADWGTEGYLAPEQVTGGSFTPATDVWGLGLVLDEATRRRVPVEFRRLIDGCLRPDAAHRMSLDEVRAIICVLMGGSNLGEGLRGRRASLDA